MENIEILAGMDEEYLIADGFNDAIIGVYDDKVVYSTKKCIDILIKDHRLDEEEAFEYFGFNVSGSYVGEKTPIFVDDLMF
jgi:hypothetical protein